MKNNFAQRLLCFGICVLWAGVTQAQISATDESGETPLQVVVTANQVETPRREVASSVTIVSAEAIAEKQQSTVLEALKSVPAVDVVQAGGLGGSTAVFLRGLNAEHTLVLIDGVEANNPISTARAFNFANLSTDNVERIEVLRGPQSVLYGSSALGGVINIITKKGAGQPTAFASFEGGSYNTFTERAGASGAQTGLNYSFAASREDSGGISAADSKFGNSEHDGYGNDSLSGRVGVDLSENLGAQMFVRYLNARADLDNSGGAFSDDRNHISYDEEFFARGEFNTNFSDGVLQQTLGFSLADIEFKDNNDPDTAHPDDFLRSRYLGRQQKVDLKNVYTPIPGLQFIGGLETQVEYGSSRLRSISAFGPFDDNFDERSATTNAYYFQTHASLADPLFLTAGLRLDDHSKFGSKLTWRAGPVLALDESGTRLFSTVGTAFKAPSLYQLYSSYGDPNLRPEKSLGVDAGIEQKLFQEQALARLTYFYNRLDDLVSFDPNTFVFSNIARAKTQGLEAEFNYQICDWLDGALNYTYTDTRDGVSGQSLLRRPRNKISASATWAVSNAAHITASMLFAGRRFDNDYSSYPASRITLGSYATFNLSGSYDLSREVSLFARLENVFDRHYEQVYGYGTLGAAAYGGFKVKL